MFRLFNFFISILVGATVLTLSDRLHAVEINLAKDGTSEYKIVLPDSPSPVQISAGNELQSFFKQVTDVELPIVSASDVKDQSIDESKLFIIGPGDLSSRLLGNGAEDNYPYDGIILKSIGNSIVLSGSANRGALYSVYEFLEKKLGCRWWTSTESTIPHQPNLTIDNDLDVWYAPKFVYRESFYRDAFNGLFAARSKCNGNNEPIPAEFGGHHSFQYFVHSSYPLIPPQKYFLEHPDWFSEIDGVRKVGYPGWSGSPSAYTEFVKKLKPEQIYEPGAQLCFSNDEMIAEMVKNARAALRDNPSASFLSISQNDWHGFCTCEKCRKIDEEEGSHMGSLLRGVNKVAEALEEEFPNLYVETLAYQYTRKPPKITRPRKNVIVRLCSIECSFAQPLNSEANHTFRDDLVGWSKVADQLFVWDYATDFAFYLLPFPNYRVIAPNMRFYQDHNVVGFFEQGDYQCETGDFVQLRNWVVSKLLWNPRLDQEALRDEFIEGYYAPELLPIYREYFDALSDAVESKNFYLSIFKPNTGEWLDLDTLNKITKLQRQALETAIRLENEQPERHKGLVAKVRREQIPLDLVWLQEYRSAKLTCKLRGVEFLGPANPYQAAKDFVAKLDEFGVTKRRESEGPKAFEAFKNDLVKGFENFERQTVVATPVFCLDLPENSWFDLQEYDMNKARLDEWTFMVDDERASNGRAVKMPGNHFEWALNWPLNDNLKYLKPTGDSKETPEFHVYAYVRCEASVDEGLSMTLGVYNERDRKSDLYKEIPVSDIKGTEYKLIDLGVVAYVPGQYLWFAPPKRPGEVDAVYIDRAIIVREH